jgi:hypothetical protein
MPMNSIKHRSNTCESCFIVMISFALMEVITLYSHGSVQCTHPAVSLSVNTPILIIKSFDQSIETIPVSIYRTHSGYSIAHRPSPSPLPRVHTILARISTLVMALRILAARISAARDVAANRVEPAPNRLLFNLVLAQLMSQEREILTPRHF